MPDIKLSEKQLKDLEQIASTIEKDGVAAGEELLQRQFPELTKELPEATEVRSSKCGVCGACAACGPTKALLAALACTIALSSDD